MSLYNMLHGLEPTAAVVLAVLNLRPEDIVRFRDAYFTYRDATYTDPVMVIMARTGSTSWTEAGDRNQHLRQLSDFISSEDDAFDTSFALYRFEMPEMLKATAMAYLRDNGRPLSIKQKLDQAMGADPTTRQKQGTEQLFQQIAEALTAILRK